MILIPEGSFKYGITQSEIRTLAAKLRAPWADIYRNELPPAERSLSAFYIDKYEVTNAQYRRFIAETGHRHPF